MRKQHQERTRKTPAPGKKEKITQYFDAIGQRYDLADTLMSFGLHFLWRKNSLMHLDINTGYRILDLCGGAGEFARRIAGTRTKGLPVVCDLSRTMLTTGKNKMDLPLDFNGADSFEKNLTGRESLKQSGLMHDSDGRSAMGQLLSCIRSHFESFCPFNPALSVLPAHTP